MSPIRQPNIVGRWCPSAGATGFRLQDFSGRGNHGTLTDMDPAADWVVSGGKRALYFDGTGNCVLIPQAGAFSATYTISMWMRRGSVTNYRNILTRGSGAVDDLELYFTTTTLVVVHNRANGGSLTNAQYPLPTVSQWVHVCLTYDSGLAATVDRWKLYFDGVLQTASANSGTFTAPSQTQAQIQIGRSEASAIFGSTRYYLGDLDDVTIFNAMLPPADVYELRRRGRGYGLCAGPRRTRYLAAGGNTAVTILDAALAWASDAVTLTQDHVLSPQASDLALTADALTLTQDQILALQDAALSLTGEAVALTQDHAASAQDASFALAADALALVQDHVLSAQAADLALTADAVTLDAAGNNNVSVQGADLAFTAEALTLTQDHVMAAQSADFAMEADAVTLDAAGNHTISAQGSNLAFDADAFAIAQDHVIVTQDASLGLTSDAVELTQDQVLAIQDAVLGLAAGAITVTSSGGGTGATAAEIWDYEIIAGVTAGAMLSELWRIHGLRSGEPMTVTQTGRVSGDISQTISGDGTTTTTVARV